MAIGRMNLLSVSKDSRYFMALAMLCLSACPAFAVDVSLTGVMGSKALLTIDGRGPEAVAVGQSASGVRLISLQGDQAVVEIDGKKRPLRVGQHAGGSGSGASGGEGGGKVVLTADSAGHFVTMGAINGGAARFLVDTGASFISIGASDARRLGIDPSKGQQGAATTANGQVQVSRVKLDSVRVGDVTLFNIDAAVQQNDMPIILLGMSFLNRMEMQRDGSTMTLKKRF